MNPGLSETGFNWRWYLKVKMAGGLTQSPKFVIMKNKEGSTSNNYCGIRVQRLLRSGCISKIYCGHATKLEGHLQCGYERVS
ncbi:MAG: hypothetical protein COS84_08895 [Armatimonadetes bacterium CG07_land_8_20_14_0_80_40_9]|nr:MAG: hypothetical protein COS84_08895 [Armatimonadetes bacterium CG07_land_8_20_14_0_80_40_9]